MPGTPNKATIGIIGAGKVATVLARLALKAGYRVQLSGSGDPEKIQLITSVLAPGAEVAWASEVAREADLVILALPLSAAFSLDPRDFDGQIVIDAMNYWLETDGENDDLGGPAASTSELVQAHFNSATVVKAFNHMGYHDLDERGRDKGAADRLAIAVAGDDAAAVNKVAQLVDDVGFDPLLIGGLAEGIKLQPFTESFGAATDTSGLQGIIDGFWDSERGGEVSAARRAARLERS